MWKGVRVVILLMILIKVIQMRVAEEGMLDWKKSFNVAVYPINADGSEVVSAYIKTLNQTTYEAVSDYFATQARHYRLPIGHPFIMTLGDEMKVKPPAPPVEGNMLAIIFWSLKFRMFAWLHQNNSAIKPDVELYLLYYDPILHPRLSHSTALQKGRIGRINLFGDKTYDEQNLVILAHELLHTVNATDKYIVENNFPQYPEGYAEPNKQPLHPQHFAELMGGRIPMTSTLAVIPYALEQTVMGEKTAQEIGWLQ